MRDGLILGPYRRVDRSEINSCLTTESVCVLDLSVRYHVHTVKLRVDNCSLEESKAAVGLVRYHIPAI